MSARRVIALGAVLLGALAGAGPAGAAPPELQADLDPERIVFGESSVSARLTIRTGEEPASLSVRVGVTGGEFVDLDGVVQGTALSVGCPKPELQGPGSVGPAGCVVPAPAPPCHKTALPDYHGTFGGEARMAVEVPARSESTLVVPLHQAHTAPWTTTRYQATFGVEGSGHSGTVVPTPRHAPAGRVGVRMSLATSVPSGGLCSEGAPEVEEGPVTIAGRSDPALAGQEVVLRYATEAAPAPREIGRVRAADDGTFELRDWRPPGPGHYEVAAAYAAQRPELADDFSLPRSFRVRAAPPRSDPDGPRPPSGDPPRPTVPAHAVVSTRRLRARAGGLVAVRVACPAAAVVPCAGRLAIRARGRVLASRGVSLAPGARRTVYVRLRPAGRRVLRRSARVRVTVRVGAAPAVRVTLRRG